HYQLGRATAGKKVRARDRRGARHTAPIEWRDTDAAPATQPLSNSEKSCGPVRVWPTLVGYTQGGRIARGPRESRAAHGRSSSIADLALLGRLFEEHRLRLLAMVQRRMDPALAAHVGAEDRR